MGRTTELRREIKRVFIPAVVAKGFVLDQKNAPTFLEFRRRTSNVVHVFHIHWDKYGKPRFTVCFGTCPSEGLVIRGKTFLPEEVPPTWLSEFGRLQPRKGALTTNWFRQDKPLLKRLLSSETLYSASRVIDQLMELFPEIESYWSTGAVGDHVEIVKLRGNV
jgi:hypothetical protein